MSARMRLRARGSDYEFVDRRIYRARDRDHRMGRNHRPSAGLVVEVGRDEAEPASGHVGDANASQRVVSEESLANRFGL